MPNTVHDRLFLHTFESFLNLSRVVEVFVVHEGMQLRCLVSLLHLAEDQLDWHKVESIRNIPNGLDVQPLHRCAHFLRLMNHQIIEEDVDRLARSLFVQSLQELDEGLGGDSLVEDHHSIDTAVDGDGCHTREVTMIIFFLIDSLVEAFRSILETRNGTLGEDTFVDIDDSLFQPPSLLQFLPTFFLPLQVFLDAVFVATFEPGHHLAFDLMFLVEATESCGGDDFVGKATMEEDGTKGQGVTCPAAQRILRSEESNVLLFQDPFFFRLLRLALLRDEISTANILDLRERDLHHLGNRSELHEGGSSSRRLAGSVA